MDSYTVGVFGVMLFMLVAMLAIGAIFVIIIVVLIRARRPSLPADLTSPLTLRAMVIRPSEQFSPAANYGSSRYGVLTLVGPTLTWRSDQGEVWQATTDRITVIGVHGALSMTAAPSVDVEIAGSGPWRMAVSTKHINKFVTNDFKRMREAGTAEHFAAALVARGARDARTS